MLPSRAFKSLHIFLLAAVAAISSAALPQDQPSGKKPKRAPSHSRSTKNNASSAEQKTARYFNSIRNQPSLLHAFLKQMPKGGDLHNHLSGAAYAESFIQWAAEDGLCVDRNVLALTSPPCDPAAGKPPATAALQDSALYGHLLDAFSMRQFHPGP